MQYKFYSLSCIIQLKCPIWSNYLEPVEHFSSKIEIPLIPSHKDIDQVVPIVVFW